MPSIYREWNSDARCVRTIDQKRNFNEENSSTTQKISFNDKNTRITERLMAAYGPQQDGRVKLELKNLHH